MQSNNDSYSILNNGNKQQIESKMAEAKITLAHKKNLRDFDAKRVEYLNKIKELTGIEFEFSAEPSLDDYLIALINESEFHHEVGEGLYGDNGYLHHVFKL